MKRKGVMSLETGVSNFGEMEACLSGLGASLDTPDTRHPTE